MQTQITIKVTKDEFVQASQVVLQTGFKLEEYLNLVFKAINSYQRAQDDVVERIFHLLPDEMVMSLAKAKMAEKNDKLLSRLLEKQREDKLSKKEREKLSSLSEEYERGTLRKAYAMAEAVRRGLMPPLTS